MALQFAELNRRGSSEKIKTDVAGDPDDPAFEGASISDCRQFAPRFKIDVLAKILRHGWISGESKADEINAFVLGEEFFFPAGRRQSHIRHAFRLIIYDG